MPETKTANLEGVALDWAVAKVIAYDEGPDATCYGPADFREQRRRTVKNGEFVYRWSSAWGQGGELIEEYSISLQRRHDGWWMASVQFNYADEPQYLHLAAAPLTAAMRCLVAYRLGDTIDVPEELL